MYDLAPRFPEKCYQESTLIGPSAYFVSDQTCDPCQGSSYPLSCKGRRFQKSNASGTPSPAHYFPKYRKHRILGGKSMQYTTARVCMVPKKKTQSYFSYPYIEKLTRTTVRLSKTSKTSRGSILKDLYKCRKEEMREASKELLRQVSTRISLPEYLKFPGEYSKASIKYKGSQWSSYRTKRKSTEVLNDTPGPGTYNLQPEKATKVVCKPPSIEIRRRTCQAPFDETQPGLQNIPGSENIIDTRRYTDGACDYLYKKQSYNKNPLGVWGQSKRFICDKNENPSPWAYSPFETTQCLRRIVKIVPFSSRSSRFKVTKTIDLGPASYSQDHKTIREKVCRSLSQMRGTARAPFGTSAQRLSSPQIECWEEEEEPEEQDYLRVSQLIPESSPMEKLEPSSELDKATCTGEEGKIIGTSLVLRDIADTAETCMVDLRQVYNNLNTRRSHRVPRENEGFLSTTYDRSEWIIAETPAHNVNWIAVDNVKVVGGASKMDYPVYNQNPKRKQDESVYYDIHPKYGSSVFKSTHNYRLKSDAELEKGFEHSPNAKTILKCFMPREILHA